MRSFLFAFILLPAISFGQILGLGKKLTEYKASNGITYRIGDTIKLGHGSSPNGDFRYLQIGGWLTAIQTGEGSDRNNVPKQMSGYGAVVKKIHSFKAHGVDKVVFAVGMGQASNFDLWIEDAIASCEIADCGAQKSPTAIVQQPDDNLDKLKKLKGLLDAGAITQAEYDAQKKKLLNQ